MEIAVGYVRLVADFQEAEKAIKDMEKNFKKAHGSIQKEADKTAKSMNKVQKAMSDAEKDTQKSARGISGSFQTITKVVSSFGSVFASVFSIARKLFQAFSAFISAQARVIAAVFKGVISAINGILAALGLLASAGGMALTALSKGFKVLLDITVEYLKLIKDLAFSFITLGKVAIGALRNLSKFLDDLTKKLVFVQLDIRYIIDQMKRFAMLFGGAIVGATAAAMKFEESFVKIRRVLDATSHEFKILNARIRDMATETTSTADQLAEMGFVAGQMGIEGVANIERFISVMDRLTQVTNIAGLEGSAAFSRLMIVMNEPLDRMENLASAVVDLGRNFAVFEDEILEMSKKVAGSGAALGLTVDQILALSAAMSAAGVRAERGGSAMSRIILNMAQAAAKGGKMLTNFAEITGYTTEKFAELIKESPEKAIQEFIDGIRDIVKEGGNWGEALEKVELGQIRVRDVILRLVNAEGVLNDTLKVSATAYEDATALATEFGVRMSTVWAQIQMLGSELMEFIRILGTPFLEVTRKAVGMLRVIARVLRNIDPEQIGVIAGFIALGATIFGLATIILMAVKALFTLATGLTLLARLVTFVLPLIGILALLNDIFGDFTLTELLNQFEKLKEKSGDVYDVLKLLYEDTRDWFKESDFIKGWAEELNEAFGAVEEAWEQYQTDKDFDAVNFTLEIGIIGTSTIENMMDDLHKALEALPEYLENPDLDVMWDDLGQKGNQFMELGRNIAQIFKLAFQIAFIDIPVLIDAILESGGFYKEAENIGNKWWENFKLAVQDHAPGILNTIEDQLKDAEDFVLDIKIQEDWVHEGVVNFEKMADDSEWSETIKAAGGVGLALRDALMAPFSRLGELIAKAVDWEETKIKVSGVIDDVSSMMDNATEAIKNSGSLEEALLSNDNVLGKSLIGFGESFAKLYMQLIIEALRFAIDAVPWFEIGKDIGSAIIAGVAEGFKGLGGIAPAKEGSAMKTYQDNFMTPGDTSNNKSFGGNVIDQIGLYKSLIEMLYPKEYQWSEGTILPGFGGGDSIPALLEPGEAVVPARVVAGGMADIENWFNNNGVRLQAGTTGNYKLAASMMSETMLDNLVENTGFTREQIDSFVRIADEQLEKLTDIAEKAPDWILNAVDTIGTFIINLLKPIIGDERAESLTEGLEFIKDIIENISGFAEGLMDIKDANDYSTHLAQLSQAGRASWRNQNLEDTPESKMVSLLEELKNNFVHFTDIFSNALTIWDNLAYIIGEDAERTYQLLQGLNHILKIISGGSEEVEVMQKGFENIRNSFEELTGSKLIGMLGGGIAGARTFGQGDNIVGTITGGLAGAGIGGPLMMGAALVSNIIGGLVPREEVDPGYKQLREQADQLNKSLREWDQSFRATKPSKKNTANWFEKLFGGKEWSYSGMEASRTSIERAQEILYALENLLGKVSSGLSNAFSADTYSDFVDSFGQSLYTTVRSSLIQAFMQSTFIERRMKDLSKAIYAGTKYDSKGRPYMTEEGKQNITDLVKVIKAYSEPFYNMLSELEIAGYGAADALESVSASLRNVPEAFKISLERFRAAYPEGGTERFPSAAMGADVISTGLVNVHAGEIIRPQSKTGGDTYIIQFSGNVYGVDDIVDVFARALDEIDTDAGLVVSGVRNGIGGRY